MSQNTARQIAVYLAENRKPNPLGYSASNFISDVQSALPKKAKKKLRQANRKVKRTASDLVDFGQRKVSDLVDSSKRKVSDLVDSGQRKLFDFIDSSIDYKPPTAQDLMSQVASESTPLSEEQIQAQKDAEAQKEKDEQEAATKRARDIAIASVATIGGVVALYFVFKK